MKIIIEQAMANGISCYEIAMMRKDEFNDFEAKLKRENLEG